MLNSPLLKFLDLNRASTSTSITRHLFASCIPISYKMAPPTSITDSGATDSVRVVTQRVQTGKLLANEAKDEWHSFGRGLVFHVSFTKQCAVECGLFEGASSETVSSTSAPTSSYFKRIAKSLLSAALSSKTGAWQADHGDADSVLNLLKSGEAQSLVLIPQASLVAKLTPGDKYLKYHAQCPRSAAETLFAAFAEALADVLVESLSRGGTTTSGSKAGGNGIGAPGNKKRGNNKDPEDKLHVAPELFFKTFGPGGWQDFDDGEYADFDENGFPTKDAKTGEEIPKSRKKKLEKIWSKYKEKWKKQGAAAGGEQGGGEVAASASGEDGVAAVATFTPSDRPMTDEQAHEAKNKEPEVPAPAQVVDKVLTSAESLSSKVANITLADPKSGKPQLVIGTFGGRQGLEFCSAGPFTHSFQFPVSC
ncbi:unnamed protein product [Amoebophrya sp. A25]|nr:unnamed protein product [Amoebophrya sp. A25]|eukprot:GSA25T00024173001.1